MTATYPMSPNTEPTPEASPLELEIDGPDSQRRVTVAFRLLLAIPQFFALALLGIAAGIVMIIGWFGALALGRLPEFAERFLSDYLRYGARVIAYYYLLVDRYPPFSFDAPDYPVRIDFQTTPVNRLAVLFRIILVIPAYLLTAFVGLGWYTTSFVLWLIVLIKGTVPETVFGATAALMRFSIRFQAYFMMLTSVYPGGFFGDATESAPQDASAQSAPEQAASLPRRGTRPLILTTGARVLLIVFIVLGIATEGWNITSSIQQAQHQQHMYSTGEVTPN